MEPMELDDDSIGHSPRTFHATPSNQRVTDPGSRSATCFSPSTYASGMKSQPSQQRYNQHSALSSSTPVFGYPQHSAPSPFKTGIASLVRSAVFSATPDGSRSPAPAQTSFSRRETPVQGLSESRRGFGPVSPDGTSCASVETSDGSDVSEMEVGQASPSPSWDRVRSALSSFSLFKSEASNEQDSVQALSLTGKESEAEKRETTKMSGSSVSLWEPTLSVVQAGASFKHASRKRKASASPPKSAVSATQPSTPMRKLVGHGQSGDDEDTTSTARRAQLGPKVSFPPTSQKSRLWSCGFCLKLSSTLTVLLVVICAVLLQKHVAVHRENFAKIDAELLRNEMASKVFGQHIAMTVVPSSIEYYLHALRAGNDSCDDDSCFLPPLALSFHGWTGVGKNFVSDIITSLFPARMVTKFLIPYHFPHPHQDQLYRGQVETWVLSNITAFSVNFFIFDEMDKATPGVIRGIENAIAKLTRQNSYQSPSVFLFLSNSFGAEINQQVFKAMNDGRDRESLTLEDFAHFVVDKEDTWYQQLESSGVVVTAVPFLPLEKQHIVQCIRRDLVSKKLSTHANIVSRVLQELSFLKLPGGMQFSQTGCKRVSDKVNLVAFD